MHNKLDICFLYDEDDVKTGIKNLLKISSNQIKKHGLSPKFLNRQLKAKESLALPIDLLNHQMINPLFKGERPLIISEDEQLLALHKPVRIHCHPLKYSESDNLLSFLRSENYAELLEVNKDSYDRGLIYRLDFETSGLILYAKSDELYQKLRDNFSSVVIEKSYLAIVTGRCELQGHFTHYLKDTGIKGAVIQECDKDTTNAKQADCELESLDYNSQQDVSLVKVKLKQGHRHQIRKQLELLGYSILGDPLYGKRKAERMFLHCYAYTLDLDEKCSYQDNNLGLFSNFFNFNREL